MNLASFLQNVLRAYPGAEDVAKALCTDPVIGPAFHYYMVMEHKAGLMIQQRGKTYYVTRQSSIRGTASYELYSFVMYRNDPSGNVDQNPKVAYRLYDNEWNTWVTVPHDI
ncbi:hypothetical protein WELLINGTON_49 [Erwinia phage Wellington]|uniref:Uncharacterized protein n=1 Tax=Erwinia phage Wellington TaxID=2267653 RepID=A0A345BL59_9CAUD|nr:hypothetical protein HOT70_gp252 [Erwinia phage Wellington]AXF51180.1 hypothetical protein WELLINGTON_49 [Erwinia phage Wellington]